MHALFNPLAILLLPGHIGRLIGFSVPCTRVNITQLLPEVGPQFEFSALALTRMSAKAVISSTLRSTYSPPGALLFRRIGSKR